jgi:RNA polymerase sigma-70 factor (ECF subfamily)
MLQVEDFQSLRPLLFSIAYRMLGSATEAEDVLQDAWVRYSAAAPSEIRSLKAFLTTIVTRLALDRLKSTRSVREQYVGPWLPEPVLTEGRPEPEHSVLLAESLTMAFLVLLDTLSPEERAVFLLREIFEYSYGEIASILNTSDPNCRQLLHRAKQRLAAAKPHSDRTREEKRHLAQRFVNAMLGGDGAELTRVLAEDVGFWGDGGGRVAAAKHPIFGREKVADLLLGIRRTAPSVGIPLEKISAEIVEINFDPAVVVRVDGRLDSVYVFTVSREGIAAIRVVRNPEKLVYIARQLDERTNLRANS